MILLVLEAIRRSKLESLCLDDNALEPDGFIAFLDAINNTNIAYLNLNDNALGDEAAVLMTNNLHRNRHLKKIDMMNNGITDIGVR